MSDVSKRSSEYPKLMEPSKQLRNKRTAPPDSLNCLVEGHQHGLYHGHQCRGNCQLRQ
ncbi:hypothetical protein AK812_SmicGene45506, partial [Symbiodinium microadriaticum]